MSMTDEIRSLKTLAGQRLREGRIAEAAALFENLVALEPDAPNNWFNLGYSRRMARKYQPALDAYDEALRRGVANPEEAHINRAVILSEHLYAMDAAADELRKAVVTNPRAVTAWLNLGNLHEDLGDTTAAREAYSKVLEIDPRNGRATARIAGIDVYEEGTGSTIESLREAAARTWPTLEDRAEVHFALANALDNAGKYSDAFQAVSAANGFAANARDPRLRYDRAAQERLVDALIALPPLKGTEAFQADASPIFICGMFRSGSTLVEQLLARHPEVTAGGELEFIPAMVREELAPYPQSLASLSSERFQALRDTYLRQIRELLPDARRVTDKRPDNFLHLALIRALFPQARIVHTVRHPLDTILSAYMLYFGDHVRYSESLDDLAHYYIQYRRLMDHWRSRFGGDIHDVDYDSLVGEPRREIEALLTFCGLQWDEACLSHAPSQAVRTASNWQVRKPLHSKSSGRWRNYARELEPVRKQLDAAGLLDAAD